MVDGVERVRRALVMAGQVDTILAYPDGALTAADAAFVLAAFVLAATGFAAGGVSPVGLSGPVSMVIDEDLLALDPVWAAAGSPQHVFRTSAAEIVRMTGAVVAGVRV